MLIFDYYMHLHKIHGGSICIEQMSAMPSEVYFLHICIKVVIVKKHLFFVLPWWWCTLIRDPRFKKAQKYWSLLSITIVSPGNDIEWFHLMLTVWRNVIISVELIFYNYICIYYKQRKGDTLPKVVIIITHENVYDIQLLLTQ